MKTTQAKPKRNAEKGATKNEKQRIPQRSQKIVDHEQKIETVKPREEKQNGKRTKPAEKK